MIEGRKGGAQHSSDLLGMCEVHDSCFCQRRRALQFIVGHRRAVRDARATSCKLNPRSPADGSRRKAGLLPARDREGGTGLRSVQGFRREFLFFLEWESFNRRSGEISSDVGTDTYNGQENWEVPSLRSAAVSGPRFPRGYLTQHASNSGCRTSGLNTKLTFSEASVIATVTVYWAVAIQRHE